MKTFSEIIKVAEEKYGPLNLVSFEEKEVGGKKVWRLRIGTIGGPMQSLYAETLDSMYKRFETAPSLTELRNRIKKIKERPE